MTRYKGDFPKSSKNCTKCKSKCKLKDMYLNDPFPYVYKKGVPLPKIYLCKQCNERA